MPQLEIENIHTSYGLSKVLFGVSLTVDAGQCVSLIGRNGVGKTTTMRSVIGLTPANQGRIVFADTDITHMPTHRISNLGLGFVPEERRIFPELTVWENLDDRVKVVLHGALDVLRELLRLAKITIFSCAQLTNLGTERMLGLLHVDADSVVVNYAHTNNEPETPVECVTSFDDFLGRIWTDVLKGNRVAVSVRHASDAVRFNKWIQKEIATYNKNHQQEPLSVESVAWTADWLHGRKESPASDVTKWLTVNDIGVLFYTTAMSPGMSIDHELGYWARVYMHVGNSGAGASARSMGQMAARVRSVVHKTVIMYVQPRGKSGKEVSSMDAIQAVLMEYRDERLLRLDADSNVVVDLKPGPLNDARLKRKVEQMRAGNFLLGEDVVDSMSNSEIVDIVTIDVEPSPQWEEVVEEEKEAQVVAGLHLFQDELPRVDWFPNGVYPPELLRAQKYTHIANTVPSEFVKPNFRSEHTMSPAAFACIHDKYEQLLVVQQLARIDPQRIEEELELHSHIDRLTNSSGLKLTTGVHKAVTVISALLAVVGSENADVSSITTVGNMMEVISPEYRPAARREAHNWLSSQWKIVRTMPSRNCHLDKVIPDQDDTDKWHECLKRVLMEKAGLSWRRTKKGETRFKLTPLSIWKKLGISIPRYTAWYNSPGSKNFGIVQRSMQCCVECDGAGDEVRCVRQQGMWRCVVKGAQGSYSHRRPFTPLDVKHETEQKSIQAQPEDNTLLVDRLVRHLGFDNGLQLGGDGVSSGDMKREWAAATVKQQDVSRILESYAVDLNQVLEDRTQTKKARRLANIVLQKHDQLSIEHTRSKRNTPSVFTIVSKRQ
jgi:ABC-type Fe3+/spermidine/putrescine transport system ATPase subunit